MNHRLSSSILSAAAAVSLAAAGPALSTASASTMPGLMTVPLSLPAASYKVSTDAQLAAALQQAQPGQVIHLTSGAQFSRIDDARVGRAGWVTISGAGDAQTPTVAGVKLDGSRYLRFTNLKFTHTVSIHAAANGQPADNIQVFNSQITCGSTVTDTQGVGIGIRSRAQNITFSGDYVHDCVTGFASISQDEPSTNVSLTHNLFQDFYGDAIDLGAMHHMTIAGNVIRDIAHSPASYDQHDDAIQFSGNTNGVAITHNVLANCLDQLLLIQDAVAGGTTGTAVNQNILVAHNLMYGNGAYAVQDQGGLATSFIDNTIWDNHYGSLLLRPGVTGLVPTDTVVEGNILETYGTLTVKPAVEQDNLIENPVRGFLPGPGDITGVTPSFVEPSAGDFELVAGTVGSGTGTSSTSTSATASPSSTATSSTLGAFAPGDPQVGYGAPMWGVS